MPGLAPAQHRCDWEHLARNPLAPGSERTIGLSPRLRGDRAGVLEARPHQRRRRRVVKDDRLDLVEKHRCKAQPRNEVPGQDQLEGDQITIRGRERALLGAGKGERAESSPVMLMISVLMTASTATRSPTTRDQDVQAEEKFWLEWDALVATVNRARGRASVANDGELTMSQYRLMRAVAHLAHPRVCDLADRVGVSQPTVARMLGTLEKGGLVKRSVRTDDRREHDVAMTDRGEQLLERKHSFVSGHRRRLWESLSLDERKDLRRLTRRLSEIVEAL